MVESAASCVDPSSVIGDRFLIYPEVHLWCLLIGSPHMHISCFRRLACRACARAHADLSTCCSCSHEVYVLSTVAMGDVCRHAGSSHSLSYAVSIGIWL
jgi:hypothetical protein